MLNLWDITAFEEHPCIVNGDSVAKPNINNDTDLFVWLQGHFSTFLLWLKNDAGHIDVESFFIEVTCDLNLNLLRSLLIWVARTSLLLVKIVYVCIVNGILNSYENTFNCVVSYISVNNESQFFLLILSN
jgi:hypothetical protein